MTTETPRRDKSTAYTEKFCAHLVHLVHPVHSVHFVHPVHLVHSVHLVHPGFNVSNPPG
ncbi:MAG: hypothetical protein ACOYI9_11630 [Candidatus Hydrogenedentales bacterium]